MQIPNADRAVVDFDKVTGYLLNPEHPDGAGKARFFLAAGFSSSEWEMFAQVLRALLVAPQQVRTVDSVHGRKYILKGQSTRLTAETLALGQYGSMTATESRDW